MKKLNFANVIQKLTRNEMRYVMAGSGANNGPCLPSTCLRGPKADSECKKKHPYSYCADSMCGGVRRYSCQYIND